MEKNDEKVKIVTIKSLNEIEPASKGFVDLRRKGKILRVPIRGLSLEEQQKTDEKYQIPEPPRYYKKVVGSDKPLLVEAVDDQTYRNEVRRINREQGKETVLAGIDLEIPGETLEERWVALLHTGITVGDLNVISEGILTLSNLSEKDIAQAKDFFA